MKSRRMKITNIMSFIEAVKTCLVEKYCTFSGRATRSEFWWFQLFTFLAMFISVGISALLMESLDSEGGIVIYVVTWILLLIPNLSVIVRRLHDVGKSGWFILIGLIPYLGAFILFIKYLSPSVDDSSDKTEQKIIQ